MGHIAADFPDHGPGKMVPADVIHLDCERDGIFIGPEVGAVVKPGNHRIGIAVFRELVFDGDDVVVFRTGADRGARLKQAIVGIGNVRPFVTVEGHAKNDFVRRHAQPEKSLDASIIIAGRTRIQQRLIERSNKAGGVVPWTVKVETHYVDGAKRMLDCVEIDVLVGPTVGVDGEGESHVRADLIELLAEFFQKRGEICHVRVAGGVFPVDVEAIEDAGFVKARSKIAVDIHIHAAFHEGCAIRGQRGCAKGVRGSTAAADRHDNVQLRVPFLQFLELVEIAHESTGRLAIGLAVDGFIGGESELVVGVGIEARALIVDHVGEGVIEMGQARRGAAGDYVLDEITAVPKSTVVDTPLRKVADKFGCGKVLHPFSRFQGWLLGEKGTGSYEQECAKTLHEFHGMDLRDCGSQVRATG